jgi:hypothetical protein
MFEKLLSLLLHAKGGAVATVLVLGASGALVTASVENGLTTVTITQPSTTTTAGSTTTTTDPVILALFNNSKKNGSTEPEGSTEPATGNGCSDAAHATNEQVKRVNDAYKTDHAAVLALSKDAPKTDEARKLVKDADSKIKGFRQEAVKAIHELFKSDECKGNDDEDQDEDNDDEDEGSTTGTTNGTTSTTTTTVAISGTTPKRSRTPRSRRWTTRSRTSRPSSRRRQRRPQPRTRTSRPVSQTRDATATTTRARAKVTTN